MEDGLWKTLEGRFEDAIEHLPRALAAEGFGILAQIDLGEVLRTRRYRIVSPTDATTRAAHVDAVPSSLVLRQAHGGAVRLGVVTPIDAPAGGAPTDRSTELARRLRRVLAAMP